MRDPDPRVKMKCPNCHEDVIATISTLADGYTTMTHHPHASTLYRSGWWCQSKEYPSD